MKPFHLPPIHQYFLITATTLAALLHSGGGATGQGPKPHAQPPDLDKSDARLKRAAKILERIVSLDEGPQFISIINSQVVVRTPGIEKVVKMGLAAIPALLDLLRCDDLSFDTFTRCYSACDQILRQKDPKMTVYWQGGCDTKEIRRGVNRLYPWGQIQVAKFRREVRRDIADKYQQILKKQETKTIQEKNK